jgi:hypothetical protein
MGIHNLGWVQLNLITFLEINPWIKSIVINSNGFCFKCKHYFQNLEGVCPQNTGATMSIALFLLTNSI